MICIPVCNAATTPGRRLSALDVELEPRKRHGFMQRRSVRSAIGESDYFGFLKMREAVSAAALDFANVG
jgi:hypothetical protein